mmetsp:Transcript_42330/g.99468  ORF Transcript_42330/g.99468 Transcript_42330/m.99468 type:complete len:353 (-) Transcript_42330:1868-2926(-)
MAWRLHGARLRRWPRTPDLHHLLFCRPPGGLTHHDHQAIRRRRHRRRPWRLCRGHPRRAARLQHRLHRRVEERRRWARPGGHLHQCRLHPVQGAAAVQRALRAPQPPLCRPRHHGRQRQDRCRPDAGPQGHRGEAEQRRHPLPVQEEQGDVLPRSRQLRRSAGRRLRAQGGGGHDPGQAGHPRHRLQCPRPARRTLRRREHPLERRRPARRHHAGHPGRDRLRRDRPGDGLGLAPPGRQGHGARSPAHLPRRGGRIGRQGSRQDLQEAGPGHPAGRQDHRGQVRQVRRHRRLHRRQGRRADAGGRQAHRLHRPRAQHHRPERRGGGPEARRAWCHRRRRRVQDQPARRLGHR